MSVDTINKRLPQLEQAAQVSLLKPTGESEKCSSYLKLSTGRKLLVTMPEADPSKSISTNFELSTVNKVAQELLEDYGIETFVVIPNEDKEMREWLHQMQVTHFSIFCDPENIISDTLGITVSYQGAGKYPKAPEKLHILLEEGKVVCMRDTVKDYEFQDLLMKVWKTFSKRTTPSKREGTTVSIFCTTM